MNINDINDINDINENYSPVEPNKYQFQGLENLTSEYNTPISGNIENVYICAYRVNNKIKNPFLEYLLQRNHNDELSFLSLYFPEDCKDIMSLVLRLDSILTLLLVGSNAALKIDRSFVECYKGFYEYDKSMYMFFDLSNKHVCL